MSQESSRDADGLIDAPVDDEIKDDPLAELARIVSAGSVFGSIPYVNPQPVDVPVSDVPVSDVPVSDVPVSDVPVSDVNVPELTETVAVDPVFEDESPDAITTDQGVAALDDELGGVTVLSDGEANHDERNEGPAFITQSPEMIAASVIDSGALADDLTSNLMGELESALGSQLEAELLSELQSDPVVSPFGSKDLDDLSLNTIVTELASEPLEVVDGSPPEPNDAEGIADFIEPVEATEVTKPDAIPEAVVAFDVPNVGGEVDEAAKLSKQSDAIDEALNLDSFFDTEFAAATGSISPQTSAPVDAEFPNFVDEVTIGNLAGSAAAPTQAGVSVAEGDIDPLDTIRLEPVDENHSFDVSEDEQPQGRSKSLLAIAAVLIVAVIGGVAGYFALGTGGSDDADVVITASDEPVRVKPTDPGGKLIPNQDRTVYETISGTEKAEDASGDLVDRSETLIVGVENKAENATPRVVLPGPSNDALVSSTKPPQGPRTVRTVIVRPDGSLVPDVETSTEQNVTPEIVSPERSSQAPSIVTTNQDDLIPRQVETEAITRQAVPTIAETRVVPEPGAPVEAEAPPLGPPDTDPVPDVSRQVAVLAPLPRANTFRTARAQTQRSVALEQSTPSASGAPIALRPSIPEQGNNPPAPAASAPVANAPAASAPRPSSSGSFVVQLSSQRSAEQAQTTFRGLQRRFSILSSYSPIVQRADLGDRGVYHRLQVGKFETRADAVSLCESLKAAGGDCIVSRN